MKQNLLKLLPFSSRWADLLAAALAFLFGFYFDLTPYRLSSGFPLAESAVFLLICRVMGGCFLALIVLALLRASRDLLGLGRIGWLRALILLAAVNILTLFYVLTAKTVYTWDTAGYWMVARSLSEEWLGRSQIFTVLRSTVHEDYNYLLAFPISIVMRVFGGSRAVFLFSISNLYTFPAVWGLASMVRGKKCGRFILCALFPMLVYTGVVGFVDTAACAAAIWAYVIYHSDRPPVSRGVMSGFLLVVSFLLRRYFFFFAASFGVAALLKKLLFERKNWADFAGLFSACAVCAVYFTPNFLLEKVLGTDYRDIYSAYDLGLRSDALLICRYFGFILLILLAVWSIVRLIRCPESRGKTVFSLLQLAVCFAVFVAVQSHGQQHLLLYIPGLTMLASSAVAALPAPGTGLLAAVILINCLIPKTQPGSIGEIPGYAPLPSFTFYGPQRQDIDQLLELSDYMDSLCAGEPKTAAVACSSFLLNGETLLNLRPSLNLPETETPMSYIYMASVDKRDGFSWNALTADYLVVGDPVQVHLGEENQRIITLAVRAVLNGDGLGAAYRRLDVSFTLSDGSSVYVYERTRDITQAEKETLSEALISYYPDYAWLYQVPAGE